jgi:hypothetical protein
VSYQIIVVFHITTSRKLTKSSFIGLLHEQSSVKFDSCGLSLAYIFIATCGVP